MHPTFLGPLAAVLLGAPFPLAQAPKEAALKEYEKRRLESLLRSGQRHLEYGAEIRKRGLTTQSAEQILLSVEVSDGRNPGAVTVLGLMRSLDDRFWSKKAPRPTRAGIDAYAREAGKLLRQDRKERLDLGLWAHARGLAEEAHGEFREMLLRRDEPLEFDAGGALVVDDGRIPKEAAGRIRQEAIEINGRLYVRDAFLSRIPALGQIWERTSPALRVRSTRSAAEAERLHALGTSLLPLLEEDLGARPDRRLNVAILSERKTYEAYLDASGLPDHKSVSGLAHMSAFVALVCGEGLEGETFDGVVLHELTHLYDLGCSRAVMPAWYTEGLAETYGGAGTFRWEGGKLEVGMDLARERLDVLRTERFPLPEFLTADPLTLWGKDRDAARRLYTQSWAFLRYLRTGAGPEITSRFERWEAMCRGTAIGAEAGALEKKDRAPAEGLFTEAIGVGLDKLEAGFAAWLEGR